MNVLIIVTAALTGPISNDFELAVEAPVPAHVTYVAPAAFDIPVSALALGAGDALGCQLFAIEVVARRNDAFSSIASAD